MVVTVVVVVVWYFGIYRVERKKWLLSKTETTPTTSP